MIVLFGTLSYDSGLPTHMIRRMLFSVLIILPAGITLGHQGEFTQSKKPLLFLITSQGGNIVGRPCTVFLPILMTTQCLTQWVWLPTPSCLSLNQLWCLMARYHLHLLQMRPGESTVAVGAWIWRKHLSSTVLGYSPSGVPPWILAPNVTDL